MRELLWAVRVLGWRRVWNSRRALRWGWEGAIRGYCLTRAIQTALGLGLLVAMRREGRIDARAFAHENGLVPDVVVALCEYLYARRVLARVDGWFLLDEWGRLLVDDELLSGWFTLVEGYEPVLHALAPLATGQVRYGEGVVRDPERVAVGSGRASASLYFPLVVDLVRQKGWGAVLDIGCGDGTFLRRLCQALPRVRGIGIDLAAAAIARGRETLAAEGWNGRIELHHGDAVDVDRLGGALGRFEAATSFFVLHELATRDGTDQLLRFLVRFRSAYPEAALVVVETLRPDAAVLRRRPGPAVEYYFLHDLSGQVPLGREAWPRLLEAAGFGSVEERHLAFARSAIYVSR